MNKMKNIQSLTRSELLQGWIASGIKSGPYTWQRGEALMGVHGAVQLAVGGTHQVSIEPSIKFSDSVIVIDGSHRIPVEFIRHQPA